MIIITFPNGADWFKANWVFRQLAADAGRHFSSDNDLLRELERAQAIGALFLNDMETSLAAKVSDALKSTAERTIRGEIEGWKPQDQAGRAQYLDSLTELLDIIRTQQIE